MWILPGAKGLPELMDTNNKTLLAQMIVIYRW